MDFDHLIRGFLALIFVLGLLGVFALIAKRLGFTPRATKINTTAQKRLSITEVLSIDAKRKLLLLKTDNREHLILLGADRDLVIESGKEIINENINNEIPSEKNKKDLKNMFFRR